MSTSFIAIDSSPATRRRLAAAIGLGLSGMLPQVLRATEDDVPAAGTGSPDGAAGVAAEGKQGQSSLTLIVRADHKPAGAADVQLEAVAGEAWTRTFVTNAQGEVKIGSLPTCKIRVRVVASGWRTLQTVLALENGANRLEMELQPNGPVPN
jgi:hypothetical protein